MKPRILKAILLGFLIGIAGLVLSPFHVALDIEENAGLGLLFKLRGAIQAPPHVVVVSIDKESSENLNLPDNPDKWPRSLHARLTENLLREGARVIAFDVHFTEPRSADADNLFADAMMKACNVLLCEPLKAKEIPLSDKGEVNAAKHTIVRTVQPIDIFSSSALATAPFILPRIPFKVNRYSTFEAGAGDSPSMPVMALQTYTLQIYDTFADLLEKATPQQAGKLPRDIDTVIKTRGIKSLISAIREIFESDPLLADRMLNALESPKNSSIDMRTRQLLKALIKMYRGSNSRYINYYGPPGTIVTIPYYQALQIHAGSVNNKKIDLKDKAVFVGLSEVLLAERKDSFYTVFSQANGVFIGGVEIAATAFSNLLDDTPVKPVSLYIYIPIILLWGILMGSICRMFPVVLAALSVVGLSIGYLFVAWYQFQSGNNWLPVVIPLYFQAPLAFFGAVVWNYSDANKERLKIRKAFEHYLPKNVVDQLAKDIANLGSRSEVVYGICLCTDAEHYTTLSETMEPAELGKVMNKYFETIFKPVKQYGGFISTLAGDSMLALWVSASPEADLRGKACSAALDIQKALQQYSQAPDALQIRTRIGLHSGEVLLGNLGAMDHFQYTPVGDIVNSAARIEGLNKYLGTQVLVTEDVLHQLNGFLTREAGTFRLKGKVKPIVIHELVSRIEESDEKQREACAIFAEALNAFRRRNWDEAIEKFNKSAIDLGGDKVSLFYLKLCEEHKVNPPEEPWDGVIHMEKK